METNRTIMGVDTAKRVFQLYCVEQDTGEELSVRPHCALDLLPPMEFLHKNRPAESNQSHMS